MRFLLITSISFINKNHFIKFLNFFFFKKRGEKRKKCIIIFHYMTTAKPILLRLKRELEMISQSPSPGVTAWMINDDITHLGALIIGPDDSPYEKGSYILDIQIPERYPFEPPRVRFETPIYHPNIDTEGMFTEITTAQAMYLVISFSLSLTTGRVCLDTLKMPPQGSWSPSVNVNTLLLTLRLLMGTPNADDGLMPEIVTSC